MTVFRWILLVLAFTPAAFARDVEIPFPVRKSTTASRDGATYIVEGRQRLGMGVTISVKQNTRILGRGEDPVLEVAGVLIIEGQPRQEVIIENVRIEPAKQFQGIRIEWARMLSGSIEIAEDTSVSGALTIDSSTIMGPINLTFSKGKVRFENAEFRSLVEINGKPSKDSRFAFAPLAIRIMNCRGGLSERYKLISGIHAGLRITGAKDVLLRANWMVGGDYEFADCGKLMFDGNTVVECATTFKQSSAGCFKKTRVTKCDFYAGSVTFSAPKAEKRDKVPVDKCWFGGITSTDDVLQNWVLDCSRDPNCNVKVMLRKLNKRPLGIGGTPMR